MSVDNILEINYAQMKSFIDRQTWAFSESEEGDIKRIDLQSGKSKCCVKVYKTGTIQVQGGASKLKETIEKAKEAIENEEVLGELLPFEIERFPDVLKETIPNVDPVIVRFVAEAITSVKAGSLLGCAFLLGGASEKAFRLLVDSYATAIANEELQKKFRDRTNGKFISRVYDEFKRSFKSSKNKPSEFGWTNDLEIKIEQIFQFCRICRNETGHPHLPPNLDKGILLANMGQFVKYVADLYKLIEYYESNKVSL